MINEPQFAALTAAVVYQTTVLHMIERRITSCGYRTTQDQSKKGRRFIIPITFAALAASVCLLVGCGTSGVGFDVRVTIPTQTNNVAIPAGSDKTIGIR